MSSINPFFTMNYAQPPEYHFSHDSVFLARVVFEYIQKNQLSYSHILDLCAGCGIIGMDLLIHRLQNKLPEPLRLDFLDVQSAYQDFYNKNWSLLKKSYSHCTTSQFFLMNYAEVKNSPGLQNQYDLITCNPPYFLKNHGKLSKSDFKNRCRFYLDSDLNNLIDAISCLLKVGGHAFVLLKSLNDHGLCTEKELISFSKILEIRKIDSIRGTDLFEIIKL